MSRRRPLAWRGDGSRPGGALVAAFGESALGLVWFPLPEESPWTEHSAARFPIDGRTLDEERARVKTFLSQCPAPHG